MSRVQSSSNKMREIKTKHKNLVKAAEFENRKTLIAQKTNRDLDVKKQVLFTEDT